jgi:hypothetical protein
VEEITLSTQAKGKKMTPHWILILMLNGQVADFPDKYKTNAACEEHRKLIERALKQAESTATVRCEWKQSKEK